MRPAVAVTLDRQRQKLPICQATRDPGRRTVLSVRRGPARRVPGFTLSADGPPGPGSFSLRQWDFRNPGPVASGFSPDGVAQPAVLSRLPSGSGTCWYDSSERTFCTASSIRVLRNRAAGLGLRPQHLRTHDGHLCAPAASGNRRRVATPPGGSEIASTSPPSLRVLTAISSMRSGTADSAAPQPGQCPPAAARCRIVRRRTRGRSPSSGTISNWTACWLAAAAQSCRPATGPVSGQWPGPPGVARAPLPSAR